MGSAAALVALAGIGSLTAAWTLPRLPLRDGEPPRAQRYPERADPGRDAFYAVSGHTELSQSILYHDLGSSIANARRADVLFLGNSRLLLGLREEFLVPRGEALGVRLFALACGYAEGMRFPLELIRKHDLRPRVVVASGGPHWFNDSLSPVAQAALEMTRFDAAKQWLETAGAWNLRSRLHGPLPRLDVFGRRLHARWVTYRSSRTGWWRPVAEPSGRFEAGLAAGEGSDWSGRLPAARTLKRELDSRDAQLVLTLVPYRDAHAGHLPFLSEALGVPAIVPDFEGITLADGSHLNRESAEKLSKAFWESFVALPEVRTALGLGDRP